MKSVAVDDEKKKKKKKAESEMDSSVYCFVQANAAARDMRHPLTGLQGWK